jgi:hypothetical protein
MTLSFDPAQKSNHREKKPIAVPNATTVMRVRRLAFQIIAIAAPQVPPAKMRSQGENGRRRGFSLSTIIVPKTRPTIVHEMTNFGDKRAAHPPSRTNSCGKTPNKKNPTADRKTMATLPLVVVMNQVWSQDRSGGFLVKAGLLSMVYITPIYPNNYRI